MFGPLSRQSSRKVLASRRSTLEACVIDALERRLCLSAVDEVPEGYVALDTVVFGSQVISPNTVPVFPFPTTPDAYFQAGVTYYLQASGQLNAGFNALFDAEFTYSYTGGGSWANVVDQYSNPDVDFGLKFSQTSSTPRWSDQPSPPVSELTYFTSYTPASNGTVTLEMVWQPGGHTGGEIQLTVFGPNEPAIRAVNGRGNTLPPKPYAMNYHGGAEPAAGLGRANVEYASGVVAIDGPDLTSSALDVDWGVSRSWMNTPSGMASKSNLGRGWMISQLPFVQKPTGTSTLGVVSQDLQFHWFDQSGSTYTARFFDRSILTAASSEFTFTAVDGTRITFDDFTSTGARKGQFKKLTSASGYTIEVPAIDGYDSNGRILKVQRSDGSATIEQYVYTYATNQVASITLSRSVNGGTDWTPVRSVEYSYYGSGTNSGNGLQGDLKSAVIKDSVGAVIDNYYYRYYINRAGGEGYARGLRIVLNPRSYARVRAAFADAVDTLTDAQIAPFADYFLKYDIGQRVKSITLQASGEGNGGLVTYGYTYVRRQSASSHNAWSSKTTETLAGGGTLVAYSNGYGQPLLEKFTENSGSRSWLTGFQYDSEGRQILMVAPSGMSTSSGSGFLQVIDDGSSDYFANTTGLNHVQTFFTTGTGQSFLKQEFVRQGYSASANGTLVKEYAYTSHTDTVGSVTYPISSVAVDSDGNGTVDQTTSYSFDEWYTGTNQPKKVTTTYPAVSAGNNGRAAADTEEVIYDSFGNVAWLKDGDGYLQHFEWNVATGGMTKHVTDAAAATGSPTRGSGLPTALALTSDFEVLLADPFGRPTKIEDAKDNLTYVVYNDAQHEIRSYPGFAASTGTTTGPIFIQREYRPTAYVSSSGSRPVFYEEFFTSAAPVVANSRPQGSETISSSNVIRLARWITGNAGELAEADAYFNVGSYNASQAKFGSASNDSASGNYHATTYSYNALGWNSAVTLPTGTTYASLFDDLGRVIGQQVGSPYGDPATVREFEYDDPSDTISGGGIGDGNVTKVVEIPGGSVDSRATRLVYDWRNRLQATKSGATSSPSTESASAQRQAQYLSYDNLDRITAIEQFDADTASLNVGTALAGISNPITFTSGAVNDRRRGKDTYAYDEQGRLFRSNHFSVAYTDTASTLGGSLQTDLWFDKRGNVMKQRVPNGPVAKFAFDGANRLSGRYVTDASDDALPGASGTWDAADDVSGDKVLEQNEFTFDANGNLTLQTTRQRGHLTTGTGALGTATTGVTARVSQNAFYYDAADRLVDTVDVGANPGSITLSSVPTRSDAALRNTYTYDGLGFVETITDPRGIVTRQSHDALGRLSKSVEAATSSPYTPTSSTNRTTEYTHDGSDHVLTMKAVLPGSTFQETKYIYLATTNFGTVSSNDLLTEIRYPDKSSGSASSSEKEVYGYNGLGELIGMTDRNGNTHDYTYDALGRLTNDYASSVGYGVKASVREFGFTYDSAGRLFQAKSYASRVSGVPASGVVVNEVRKLYNGLGQLTTEYQEHQGAVVTATSKKVQYTYSEMASGTNHSRLISTQYPQFLADIASRKVHSEYSSGLDNNVSRVSYLSETNASGTHLEEYSYLGLNTVVKRSRPEPGTALSYIGSTTGGDAGDLYTGLDRFGRIVDQRWYTTSSGTDFDRFKYGYDRNSNVVYKEVAVSGGGAFSELYSADSVDGNSAYDALDRLTNFQRGTLSDSNGSTGLPFDTVSPEVKYQSWNLDALGNWDTLTGTAGTESRTHNAQNQITSSPVTHDANGNTKTTTSTSNSYVYDAWNRMVEFEIPAGKSQYPFDALGRRTQEEAYEDEAEQVIIWGRHLYYSDRWQVLASDYSLIEAEARAGTFETFVWSPYYVDELVERDRTQFDQQDLDPDPEVEDWDGTFGTDRLYVHQDANYNVTSISNVSGGVARRFVYDPYGKKTADLNAAWATITNTSYWYVYHQGGRFNHVNQLYQFRNRDYSADLGRWMQQDPAGYVDGGSLYQVVVSSPVSWVDPLGLKTIFPTDANGNPLPAPTPKPTHSSTNSMSPGGSILQVIEGVITTNAPIDSAPVPGSFADWAKDTAEEIGSKFPDDRQNVTEAARHMAWQAILTYHHGSTEAKRHGDLHEKYSPPNTEADSARDQANNIVGRVIGSQVALETGRAKKSTLERVSPDEQERVKRRIIEIILDIIRAGQYATPPAAPTGEPIQP